jgi:hypothetical protein
LDLSQLLGTSIAPSVKDLALPLVDKHVRHDASPPAPSLFVASLLQAFSARQEVEGSLLPLLRKNYDAYKSFINELDDKGVDRWHCVWC